MQKLQTNAAEYLLGYARILTKNRRKRAKTTKTAQWEIIADEAGSDDKRSGKNKTPQHNLRTEDVLIMIR